MALHLGAVACGEIPAPPTPIDDRDDQIATAIEVGQLVPSVRLRVDADLGEIDPATIRGRTLILTFIALLDGDPAVDLEILDRLALLDLSLGAAHRDRLVFILVPLEGSRAAAAVVRGTLRRRGLSDPGRWLVVDDERPRVLNLAARFSVVTWETEPDRLAHTATVAVLRDGFVRDLLHGLDSWSAADLLAAVTALPRPLP